MNSLLPQIAQQIYDQLSVATQSGLSAKAIAEYLKREDFVEGGQGFLTKAEFPANKLNMRIKLPHPLLALVEHLAQERVVLGGFTLSNNSLDSGALLALNKCVWVDFDDCIIEMHVFPQLKAIYTFVNFRSSKSFRLALTRPETLSDKMVSNAAVSATFEACTFEEGLVIDKRFTDEAALNLFAVVVGRSELNGLVLRGVTQTHNPIVVKRDIEQSLPADKMVFDQVHFKAGLDINGLIANELAIKACMFDAKCTMDSAELTQLMITDSTFGGSFSAKSLTAKKLIISQSSFEHFFSVARANLSCFTMLQASFRYALDASEMVVADELRLQGAIFAQPSNFLGVEFAQHAKQNTDRETFRIIKHSFDAVGNHIEANRFYALEMEAYRREVKTQATWHEKWLLMFNAAVSYHGQNFVKPIFWIIGID